MEQESDLIEMTLSASGPITDLEHQGFSMLEINPTVSGSTPVAWGFIG